MERKLYQWQEECLERWLANNGRGIVQAVTGAGKTLLALTAVERLEKKLGREPRVKIVVPTGALMHQWNRALQEFFAASPADRGGWRKEVGMRGGGCKAPADSRYMIYVINSARYELARQILAELRNGEAVFLIADECHHYGSGQNQLIFEFLPYINLQTALFFSLGLSATLPFGRELYSLTSALGRNIYSYKIENALAHRAVCQYHIYHVKLPFQKEERGAYEELTEQMKTLYGRLFQIYPILGNMSQGERCEFLRGISGDKNRETAKMAAAYLGLIYKRRNLVCQAFARVACARDLAANLGINEKILILGERIDQAEALYKILQELYPERVGRHHSRMGQQANKNVLERFRTGDIRILIACKAMDEGIDIPDASVEIILSGTSGQRQRVQRLGRIIRRASGKETASLYYLHIEETVEDACFLPDIEESFIFELAYSPDEHKFINPFYDEISAKLLDNMQKSGMDEERIKEVERCLELGRVRSDWMLEGEDMEGRIKRARYASDKNYWICMKNLRMLLC